MLVLGWRSIQEIVTINKSGGINFSCKINNSIALNRSLIMKCKGCAESTRTVGRENTCCLHLMILPLPADSVFDCILLMGICKIPLMKLVTLLYSYSPNRSEEVPVQGLSPPISCLPSANNKE